MASYENMTPSTLAKLFEDMVRHEVAKELEKVSKEVVDKALKKAMASWEATYESFRAPDRFGDEIRITLVDKRSSDG
jgi:hypothetical protein